ncbi:MAG: primosomal protein N' [Phycisphaerales bacterium]
MSLFSGKVDAGRRFALVAVERGIDRAGDDGAELLYEIPAELESSGSLQSGERVDVPLGKRKVGGVVVASGGTELLGDIDPVKIRPILRRSGAILPNSLMELAKWIAGYYVCPLGMVLSSMIPSAVKKEIGKKIEAVLARSGDPRDGDMSKALAGLVQRVDALPASFFPASAEQLKLQLGEKTLRGIRRLIAMGVLSEQTRQVLRPSGAGEIGEHSFGGDRAVEPSPDQAAVLKGLEPLVCRDEFGVHLLFGVTGSGKTEVYLRLIAAVLKAHPDSSVIVLVPEIALTPQASERYSGRFKDLGVAVLHSGLSASRRHSEWMRAATGAARVVVGARSAVFAPVPRLGLILVDEEHDTSYKQDQLPRYHARDVAIKRAQIEGCSVVLGSATPSLETWSNAGGDSSSRAPAAPRGGARPARYQLWKLPHRVGGGALPKVQIVDMYRERQEARQLGLGDVSLLPTLRRALHSTLREGAQAILLLNRRGFATFVGCAGGASCGWVMSCERCDARMVLHRDAALRGGELLRCHHCLSECVVPRACPSCARGLVRLGAGTQRIEEELRPLLHELALPHEAMIRVDRDTMRTAQDYFSALGAFASGKARLLVGTQMIAKGLDFPGVRLVGVVSADTGLNMPDFRAGERAFQLISQVSGRAGRADSQGLVIIQTMEPGNPAIVLAAEHDYERFAAGELAARRAFSLPPQTRMARIVCRDEKQPAARERSAALAEWLRAWSGRQGGMIGVAGPLTPPVARVADQFRFGLEVTGSRAGLVQDALRAAREAGLLKSDAKTAVDVDPVSML